MDSNPVSRSKIFKRVGSKSRSSFFVSSFSESAASSLMDSYKTSINRGKHRNMQGEACQGQVFSGLLKR